MFSKRLLAEVPEARRLIVASVVARWVALLALVALSAASGSFLGALTEGRADRDAALLLAEVAAASLVVRFAASAAAEAAGSRAGSAGSSEIRARLYDKLVALGPSFRSQVPEARAASLMGDGAHQLESYLGVYMPQLFYAVLAPLTLFAFLLSISVPVAAVLLLCVPLMPAAIVVIMKTAKRVMGDYWDSYVDLGAAFLEAVRGMVTLKLYRADGERQRLLARQSEAFREATVRLLTRQLHSVTVMDVFTYGGAAIGCSVALAQFATGALACGDAFVVALLSLEMFMPMRTLGSYFHTAMGSAAVIDEMFEVIDAPEVATGDKRCEPGPVGIVCEGLGYSYGEGAQALADVSIGLDPYSYTGLTGESGSGKSTLAAVLAGELPDYRGSVKVGGVELRELAPEALHAAITVVGSSGFVFKGTFRSNLALGNPEATDYEMWNALNRCRLDDFVLRCGGLDAPVAERGANLSGGQRQRLCVARAALRDTPVYVFDEATSNIDAESEEELIAFIQEMACSKTVLVISHRLGALVWADEVGVLEEGRLVELGDHARLRAAGGAYARLWEQQDRLEGFAREASRVQATQDRAAGDADVDVPQAMAEALEKMPASVATVARQAVKTARIRALSTGCVPAGHPADVAIPGLALTEEGSEDMRDEGGAAPAAPSPSAAGEGPSRSAASSIRGLWGLGRSLRPMLARVTALGTLGHGVAIGLAAFVAAGVVGVAGEGAGLPAAAACAAAAACGLARGFLRYGERITSHDETFRTLALVRDRVFGHMRRLAPAKLAGREAGDLVSLLTADMAETLEAFYSKALSPVLVALAVSCAMVVALGLQGAGLAVVAAASYGVVGVLVPLASHALLVGESGRLRTRSVRLDSFVLEGIHGLSDLLRYGGAGLRRDELGGRMGALAARSRRIARRKACLHAAADLAVRASGVAMMLVAACLAADGRVGAGAAAVASLAFVFSFDPVVACAALGSSLQQALASAGRVLDFLDEEPATPEIADGACPEGTCDAALRRVGFSYGERAALSGVNLSVRAGAVTVIVGPSGTGKSTILRLLMRFWDADEGAVEVCGTDVRGMRTDALRAIEGCMEQETWVASGSIRDNLAFVRPQADDDELRRALEAASLARFVDSLPDGIDTHVGEGGTRLSDGERQRLGLARMFLCDAGLLLLDEPTSNLDCLNEAAVLQALSDGGKGKTVLLASHRLSACAIADEVYAVGEGRHDS